jgi:hypothetical protein
MLHGAAPPRSFPRTSFSRLTDERGRGSVGRPPGFESNDATAPRTGSGPFRGVDADQAVIAAVRHEGEPPAVGRPASDPVSPRQKKRDAASFLPSNEPTKPGGPRYATRSRWAKSPGHLPRRASRLPFEIGAPDLDRRLLRASAGFGSTPPGAAVPALAPGPTRDAGRRPRAEGGFQTVVGVVCPSTGAPSTPALRPPIRPRSPPFSIQAARRRLAFNSSGYG